MHRNILESNDWHYMCKNMKQDRAKKLENYANKYLVPMLNDFPEVRGKVYLMLRSHGFFADHKPILHITVNEKTINSCSEWRIRFITAHELLHLVQFMNGIHEQNSIKYIEKQASFFALARGYAYDYLKAFQMECKKNFCDHQFTFSYFRCDTIFKKPCRCYSEDEIKAFADILIHTAKQYDLKDNKLDFTNIIRSALNLGSE